MIREGSLEEISDGKLYHFNDMVKADCNGCKGCHACCEDMGESIILDAWDIFMLTTNLGISFEQLLPKSVELKVVDGLIYPNLKMNEQTNCCSFLDENGRCSIHEFRPGLCRLFPLGRYYDNDKTGFQYFLQIHECAAPNKTKVKVRKWLGIENLTEYEKYINDWHYFLKDLQKEIAANTNESFVKEVNMALLQIFYVSPYRKELDFYTEYYKRKEILLTRFPELTGVKG